ncbi:interferon lambda-3-like [Pelodiscus sinensis]|uniref:interferon lambda-3-like n=1 Tax=Pelodiscus sinensis TaxID=13735 RepID=UPI003F6B612A
MGHRLLVSALLLVLVETFAEGAPAKKCRLSQYRSLPSYVGQAFQDLRDKYKELVWGPAAMNCYIRLFRHKTDQLRACHSLVLLEEEVDLSIRLMQNLSESAMANWVSLPLDTLASIRADLRSCIQLKGLDHSLTAQLSSYTKWLQKSHSRKREVSARCLEQAMMFDIFRLLNEHLKYVAEKESCH